MGLSIIAALGFLIQVLLAHPNESCTEGPSCVREGLQTNVLSFVNGDNSPLLVGYDNDQPWQYEVLNGAWANNGNLTGMTFSVNRSGPLYIRDERISEIMECDVLQMTLVAQFELTDLRWTNGTSLGVPDYTVSQPYYGCAYWQAYDAKTGLLYGFVVTNVNVYGIYARLAQTGSTYATFFNLVPIFARQNPQQYNIYQLAFDKSHNTVTYRIDGNDRLVMDISGRPINSDYAMNVSQPGNEALVFPEQIQMSLGILRLDLIVSNNGGPSMSIYDYCDCRQNLELLPHGDSSSTNPASPSILAQTLSVMRMVVASIGVNRLIRIQPICKCGESESDSLSSCSAPHVCKDPSSSSDSTSDPCNAHSSDFSYW